MLALETFPVARAQRAQLAYGGGTWRWKPSGAPPVGGARLQSLGPAGGYLRWPQERWPCSQQPDVAGGAGRGRRLHRRRPSLAGGSTKTTTNRVFFQSS